MKIKECQKIWEQEEIVSLWELVKRMYFIAYACFRYPFDKGDVYINFKSRKVTREKSY